MQALTERERREHARGDLGAAAGHHERGRGGQLAPVEREDAAGDVDVAGDREVGEVQRA